MKNEIIKQDAVCTEHGRAGCSHRMKIETEKQTSSDPYEAFIEKYVEFDSNGHAFLKSSHGLAKLLKLFHKKVIYQEIAQAVQEGKRQEWKKINEIMRTRAEDLRGRIEYACRAASTEDVENINNITSGINGLFDDIKSLSTQPEEAK